MNKHYLELQTLYQTLVDERDVRTFDMNRNRDRIDEINGELQKIEFQLRQLVTS